MPDSVKRHFEAIKNELEKTAVVTVDYQTPLPLETDASDITIAATLNQDERSVAFSPDRSPTERTHSSVEKEAYAIVEFLRKWKHYLTGNHFKLVTNQRSVAFMFDNRQRSKIKTIKYNDG